MTQVRLIVKNQNVGSVYYRGKKSIGSESNSTEVAFKLGPYVFLLLIVH